jgi:hypothetical protein
LGDDSRLKRKSRGKEWITGWRDTHARGQGRCRATGIVIVIGVALLLAGDLSITLCEFDQEASGGRTPLARTDPWRHEQPQHDQDHE